jgi:hypothetical protein
VYSGILVVGEAEDGCDVAIVAFGEASNLQLVPGALQDVSLIAMGVTRGDVRGWPLAAA